MRVLAAPASLKGVLSAVDAAAALAAGVRRAGGEAIELPVADGGEGTGEVLQRVLGGTWLDVEAGDPFGRRVAARILLFSSGDTALVESAEAIGLTRLAEGELDPLRASSAGLGELLEAALGTGAGRVIVSLGGSATVDGGAGLLSVLQSWPDGVALRVACDVRNPLLGERGAARVFGPQKGASRAEVELLEQRLAAIDALRPYRDLPGAGAAGGLGAALASLGGELVSGAELVLDLIDFDAQARQATLVVTGEGTVDESTFEGKAPGAVLTRCERIAVPCVLFGGRVEPGFGARLLSGRPEQARADLIALGAELASAA